MEVKGVQLGFIEHREDKLALQWFQLYVNGAFLKTAEEGRESVASHACRRAHTGRKRGMRLKTERGRLYAYRSLHVVMNNIYIYHFGL